MALHEREKGVKMNALVLFDIDQTLLQVIGVNAHKKAFSKAIENTYGIKADMKTLSHAGMTDRQIIRELLRNNSLCDEEITSKMPECLRLMCKYYEENNEEENRVLLPGVKNLLDTLQKKGAILGVVTGNLESIGWKKLEKVRLRRFFTLGAFGSDAEERAELVIIAIKKAEKLGFEKGKIFLIGDTVRDVKAGVSNNVKVLAVATGSTSKEELEEAGAYKVFETLEKTDEIIKIIGENI